MSEHFTRNTESVTAWCNHCGQITTHPVSNGRIGRCANDHTKPISLVRAAIPEFTYHVGAHPAEGLQAIDLALHLLALDGPNSLHDGQRNLPKRKETKR